MATATIVSRTYTNPYDAQTSSFLIGNVGDVIDASFQIDVEVVSESALAGEFIVTNNDTIERVIGNWSNEGFIQGGTIDVVLNHSSGVKNVSATISTLTPSTMVLTGLTGDTLENGTYPDSGASNGTAIVESTEPITGMEFNYNLITNTEAQSGGNTASVIDGSITTFKNNNLDASDTVTVVDLVPYGFQSGMAIESATIVGLGIVSGVQSFQIDVRFMILADWDTLANFTPVSQNFVTPIVQPLPPSHINQECLTDFIRAKFQPQASNPNVFVEIDSAQQALLGNTGWFDEVLNGGTNSNTTWLGVSFANSSSINVSDVQTKDETSFQLIFGNNTPHTASTKYKLGFLWTPEDTTQYYNKNTPYQENLLYCGAGDVTPLQEGTTGTYTGFTNPDGARMDIEITNLVSVASGSSTVVVIQGNFKPNSTFGTFMDTATAGGTANLNYILWVSVGDENLSTLNSDRISKMMQFGELQTAVTNVQTFNVDNSFLNHAQASFQVGESDPVVCVEDEMAARSIIYLDTSQNEFIENLTFSIDCVSNQPVGGNVGTSTFNLESTSYDCTVYPIDASGTQQINISDTRGFIMASGVEKNLVTVERSPSDDYGTFKAYRALYSMRPRWEDWQQNLNVNVWFYDSAELNNNLNNDWANKDNLRSGSSVQWKLQYSVQLVVNRNGQRINTENAFAFSVRDYEESTVWDGAITTYNTAKTGSLFIGVNADGIRENGIIPSDKTWVEADFDLEDVLGDVGDIADYYGVIRIEEYRNGGLFKIHMLSTLLDNETTQNILVPLTGETKCKITKVSLTKIRLECYIDDAQLDTNVATYRISARLGISNLNLGKYAAQYSLKYN